MQNIIFPNPKDLINLQQHRQLDSDWILDRIDLIDLLSKYGDVKIIGAKALGLMIARDIDISVVVPNINTKTWQEIVSQLMITKHVRKVTAVDEYNYDENNVYDSENGKQYSLYIEMDTILGPDQDKNSPWEIQIHLITKNKFDEKIIDNIKLNLNDEYRLIILELKWWANEINPKLLYKSKGHFKIQSTWIYEAVLKKNVKNSAGLLSFIFNKVSQENLIYLHSLEIN